MTPTPPAPEPDHVPLWRRPARVLREHRRPYLIIHVVVYGLFLVGWWTVETGMTLVQTTPAAWVAMIPHSLTLLIELQAYILLLALPALVLLIIGAIWEAYSLRYLVYPLGQLLL